MQAKSEVYRMAEDRLVVNKYDLDAWSILIKDHQVMLIIVSVASLQVYWLFCSSNNNLFNGRRLWTGHSYVHNWILQSRRGMDEDSREFFERLVEAFPLTGRFWKIYIEQEVV